MFKEVRSILAISSGISSSCNEKDITEQKDIFQRMSGVKNFKEEILLDLLARISFIEYCIAKNKDSKENVAGLKVLFSPTSKEEHQLQREDELLEDYKDNFNNFFLKIKDIESIEEIKDFLCEEKNLKIIMNFKFEIVQEKQSEIEDFNYQCYYDSSSLDSSSFDMFSDSESDGSRTPPGVNQHATDDSSLKIKIPPYTSGKGFRDQIEEIERKIKKAIILTSSRVEDFLSPKSISSQSDPIKQEIRKRDIQLVKEKFKEPEDFLSVVKNHLFSLEILRDRLSKVNSEDELSEFVNGDYKCHSRYISAAALQYDVQFGRDVSPQSLVASTPLAEVEEVEKLVTEELTEEFYKRNFTSPKYDSKPENILNSPSPVKARRKRSDSFADGSFKPTRLFYNLEPPSPEAQDTNIKEVTKKVKEKMVKFIEEKRKEEDHKKTFGDSQRAANDNIIFPKKHYKISINKTKIIQKEDGSIILKMKDKKTKSDVEIEITTEDFEISTKSGSKSLFFIQEDKIIIDKTLLDEKLKEYYNDQVPLPTPALKALNAIRVAEKEHVLDVVR